MQKEQNLYFLQEKKVHVILILYMLTVNLDSVNFLVEFYADIVYTCMSRHLNWLRQT